MDAFVHILIAGFVIIVVILRILKKPEELAIYALIMSSTLPVIVHGNALAFGPKGTSVRFEYTLVFLGLFLAYISKWNKHYHHSRTTLSEAVFLMFLLYLASILVSMYWGSYIGIGITIQLLETYLFYFIIIRLTGRKHITKLINLMILVVAGVTGIMLLIAFTNSTTLINLINSSKFDVYYHAKEFGGQLWGKRLSILLSMYYITPIIGTLTFLLFFLKNKHRVYYGLLSLFFFINVISSGQKGYALITILGFLVVLFLLPIMGKYLPRMGKYRKSKYHSAIIMLILAVGVVYSMFMYSSIFRTRVEYLSYRFFAVQEQHQSIYQYSGALLAKEELSAGGLVAWITGFGGFKYPELGSLGFDINGPILMIYRYGIIGLVLILFLLGVAFKKAWSMFLHIPMKPEETVVVIGVMMYISAGLLLCFFRGFLFSNNFNDLSSFVILLAWMEVIYRDYSIEKSLQNTSVPQPNI